MPDSGSATISTGISSTIGRILLAIAASSEPRRRRRHGLAQRARVEPADRPERHRRDAGLDPRLLALAGLLRQLLLDAVGLARELERAADVIDLHRLPRASLRLARDQRCLALAQVVASRPAVSRAASRTFASAASLRARWASASALTSASSAARRPSRPGRRRSRPGLWHDLGKCRCALFSLLVVLARLAVASG